MTNRVPPLHPASPPPLHRASPPPFSNKLNFYEDDVDENDEIANYTIVSRDVGEKFHRDSPETVENAKTETADGHTFSSSPIAGTPDIEGFPISTDSKDCTSEEFDPDNHETTAEKSVVQETPIADVALEESSTVIDDGFPTCKDDVGNLSVFENIEEKKHSDVNINHEDNFNFTTDERNGATGEIIVDNVPNVQSISRTKESTPPKIFESNDSVTESSDDSSGIINEAAFITVENESDIEEDILDDSFQEFSDYKTDPTGENINLNFTTSLPLEKPETDGKSNIFLPTTSTEIEDAFCQKFDQPSTETGLSSSHLVTSDSSKIFESHENVESFTEREESFDDNDDFDDFVSPPLYETQSTEQLPPQNEMNLDVANELRTSTIRGDNSTTATADYWDDIFEHRGEDPIEVNLTTLDGKLNGSSIWCQLKNTDTSPVLKFNWNDSEAKKLLLATLGVDLRNILFGPRWNSEVPRFASNLKFSPLVPQKASTEDNQESQHSETTVQEPSKCASSEVSLQNSSEIRDAHFDWTSSGLMNPLDARKSIKTTKNTITSISQLENEQPVTIEYSPSNRGLSSEAAKILNSLPNLLVMEKQYIVFPVR